MSFEQDFQNATARIGELLLKEKPMYETEYYSTMTPKERVSAIQALTEALKYMLSNEEKQVLIDKIVQLTKGL